MKKILSILLALGLVLGMVVAAMPAAAQPPPYGTDWTVVDVEVAGLVAPDFLPCEFARGVYTIEFNNPASLTQGFHTISVMFPEGTGYPATWLTGHITVNTVSVFAAEITQDGDVVTFLVPETIEADDGVIIVFQPFGLAGTAIINPEAGDYFLFVTTSRAPMSTWVQSGWGSGPLGYTFYPYEIMPTVSTYGWRLDFGEAYPGIVPNFIPPFKACGQDPGVTYNEEAEMPFVSYADDDRWVTPFELSLRAFPVGCQPCPNMSAYLELTGRPTAGVARLYDTTNTTALELLHMFPTDDADFDLVWPPVTLNATPGDDWAWNMGLHFSTPGTYTFDLVLYYTGTGQCQLGCETVVRELTFDVKQQKDAYAIPLNEKWNLISLPLVPFDSDIDAMLATLAATVRPLSIWHYDAFDGEWFVYGAGQDSLTDIVDGKSYWFRMFYRPDLSPRPIRWWWVFGTEKPQPPAGPLQYQMAQGWNMAGFTSLYPMVADEYLWNWGAPDPVIYRYTRDVWNVQTWDLVAFTGQLDPGYGYWMAFPEGGYIYVP